ncbi:MAG: HU family DNA-binding protein [Haliscomenobacter sp.]|nr:HU family DNA-binding protein [Haliscomenobacter sp.]
MEKSLEIKLAEKLNISQAEADRIWKALEEALVESIVEDPEFRLRGFGTFVTVNRPAQQIKHPVSGQTYDIPAYKAVDFRASARLRAAVNPELQIEEDND